MAIIANIGYKLVELVGTATWEVIKLAVNIVEIIVQVVINI